MRRCTVLESATRRVRWSKIDAGCSGLLHRRQRRREVPAGTLVLHEGSKTGHLFVLLEGRLEVIKGDSVVAVLTEPGAMLGEMSVLLD